MPGHGDDEYWPHTKLKLKIRTHKHTSFKSIFLIYELRFAFCDLNLFVLVCSQRRVSMPPIGEGLTILSRWMRHTKQIFRIVLVVRRLLNFLFYCGMSRTVVLTWCQVDTFVRVNICMSGAVSIRTLCALPGLINVTIGSSLYVLTYILYYLYQLGISNINLSEPSFNFYKNVY